MYFSKKKTARYLNGQSLDRVIYPTEIINSPGLSMRGSWCEHEVVGLYIQKILLTANAENLIKVNKIIKKALCDLRPAK